MTVKERPGAVQALEKAETALREAASNVERTRAALETADDETGVTLAALAERFQLSEEAVVAFVQTAREALGDERSLSIEAARRGALLAAASQAWENELGPLVGTAEVRALLGVSRQRVDELLRARRLIALPGHAAHRQYPLFQFHDGRPLTSLIAAFWTLADTAASPWTAAAWCTAPDPDGLQGLSPAQWASNGRDDADLARIARQDAARLDQ